MPLTIVQINIKNWFKNKYAFTIENSKYNTDIILLNETAVPSNVSIKLRGYHVIQKSHGLYRGVAIMIRNHIQYREIPVSDPDSLAVKIFTNLGPLIISTSYIPPRFPSLPIVSMNKILNHRLPTLFIGDYNAYHPFLGYNLRENNRGRQLHALSNSRGLHHLGPHFHTFKMHRQSGNPDIAMVNNAFSIFHYKMSPGGSVGSDHIPIVFQIHIKPITELRETKSNFRKINVTDFKSRLEANQFQNLENCKVDKLNSRVELIFNNIIRAAKQASPLQYTSQIKSYSPTPKINLKLRQFQAAYSSYYNNGFPNTIYLRQLREELITLVSSHKSLLWKQITDTANKYRGQPRNFWSHINQHLNNHREKATTYLTDKQEIDDSEDSDFGETISHDILEPQDQSNFMSSTWERICRPHTGPEFKNENTIKVKKWFIRHLNEFQPAERLTFAGLISDHPLLRPVTSIELVNNIKLINNNCPGPSGITAHMIQNLPSNYNAELRNVFNYMISTRFYPLLFKKYKSIFILKPGKDKHNPLSYRPISLIETLAKLFEKLINNRLLYYIEHNNLFNERQFGFRSGRSTIQSINIISQIIEENKRQSKITLISTRDVEKAFDKLWHPGLLYKMNVQFYIDIEFVALIYNYISNRVNFPFFSNTTGPSYSPKAGVPQGSCLGPTLFAIFVNDAPDPLYKNTIINQFADDMIHIVTSDTSGPNKILSARNKLQKELGATLKWELQWKIKTNPNKIHIGFFGTNRQSIDIFSNISVNGISIPFSPSIKVLGYTLNHRGSSSKQINIRCAMARNNLSRLNRFKSASSDTKLYLYKSLIQPLLEYPPVQLSKSPAVHMSKLQIVQNKALRFVYNVKYSDYITNESLHLRAKLDSVNVRLSKLTRKALFTMKELFFPENEEAVSLPYVRLASFSDYYNTNQPLKNPQKAQAKIVNERIFQSYLDFNINILNIPNDWDGWTIPNSKYN